MIQISTEKCVGCGACLAVCPFASLELQEKKAAFKAEALCIDCLHCAASCPQEAITWEEQPAVNGKITPFPADLGQQVSNLLKSRRSCRSFTEQKVPRELIEQGLQITTWAPTGCNEQGLKWLVLEDSQKLAKFTEIMAAKTKEILPTISQMLEQGINMIFGNAKTVILAYGEERQGRTYSQDGAIAATYLELWLKSQGLASCWSGFTMLGANLIPELKTEILELEPQEQVLAALMVGYPQQQNYRHYPARKPAAIKWL